MAGGMAAPDTFDPKHYEAFKPGLEVAKVGSTFKAIDTVVRTRAARPYGSPIGRT